MRRRKQSFLFIVLFIILFLGIGYASIMTTLTINGTTDFDSNTWNVYWDHVVVSSGSVSASTPTIDTNKTTVSFSVHFTEPGEKYEFTVDAKNTGSIPAVIEGVTATINGGTTIPEYLKYTVSYEDDFPLQENQLLSVNQTQTYKVRLEYRNDIDPSYLPDDDQSLSLTVGVNYIQSSDTSQYTKKYTVGNCSGPCNTNFGIGSPLPDGYVVFDHYNADFFGNSSPPPPVLVLAILKDNAVVSDAYSALLVDGTYYYFRIGGATYNESTSSYNYDSIYFEDNARLLLSISNLSDCEITTDNTTSEVIGYYCDIPNYGWVRFYKDGWVNVMGTEPYACGGNGSQILCGG